ncbi:MAG TPA: cytochrome c oxidase subunit 3 [Hymenobacter sp.]|jgi:cytochrome c oxidase subunit 3
MNSDKERNKVGARRTPSAFARMERMPPMLMLLYLGMVGITVLFVILVGAYAQTRYLSNLPSGLHPFPRYFSISTIVLLVSSYTVNQARRLYQQDDVSNLVRCLGATMLLGAIFTGLQILGWRELAAQGALFTGESSYTYVYLISALHVAHVLGGLLYLLVLMLRTSHASRDAVRTLVFIRNPYRRLQLRILTVYWHFIDVVWLGLFVIFLFLY